MTTLRTCRLMALALLLGLLGGGTVLFTRGRPTPVEGASPPGVAAGEGPAPAVDRHGDPLPPDALARLGTTRLRHGQAACALAFTPDGKVLASTGGGTLCLSPRRSLS